MLPVLNAEQGTTGQFVVSDRHLALGAFFDTLFEQGGVMINVFQATVGDANGDHLFNSSDFVQVFQVGKYEDLLPGNADWTEGDWDLDGDFMSSDFVVAFQSGTYEAETQPSLQVPEPASSISFAIGMLCCFLFMSQSNLNNNHSLHWRKSAGDTARLCVEISRLRT